MGQNSHFQTSKDTSGFSLIEIIVAIVIISLISAFTIARFGDVGSKSGFEKDVSELVEIAGIGQSFANSQNSANCLANDRLSYIKMTKTSENEYKLQQACENFLAGTGPTISPAKDMVPPISKKMLNAKFATDLLDETLVTFLPGALTTPGPTIPMYSGSNCTCLKVSTNGIASAIQKNSCSVNGTVVNCGSSWE